MFVCLCKVVSVSVSLPGGLCLFVSVRWYLLVCLCQVVYVCCLCKVVSVSVSLPGGLCLFVSVRWYLLVCLCQVVYVCLSL